MKITPIAQGAATPVQSDKSVSPDARARAIAVASGNEVPEAAPTGDPQVDRINTRRIKMKTQVSTNRHDAPVEQVVEEVLESPINDTMEQASETEETRPLSPQFAALAKQKRALQVKERELAQREQALNSTSPAGSVDVLAELKASPLSVLQKAGVSYEQLTEAILADQDAPLDVHKLRAELKEDLKKELMGEFETREQAQERQVLSEIAREADHIISQGDYEAIQAAGQGRAVTDLIHRTFKETGEILDTQTAADLVENQLIEEALPFARIKKVQSRLAPAQEVVVQTPAPQRPNTKIMRTLTNRDSASPVLDRRARAIAAMQGTLRKG